ncbi:hypothetical protein ABIB42_002710 [Massilia sp. UYP32]
MMTPLKAPIDTPAMTSGWMRAFERPRHAAFEGAQRAAALQDQRGLAGNAGDGEIGLVQALAGPADIGAVADQRLDRARLDRRPPRGKQGARHLVVQIQAGPGAGLGAAQPGMLVAGLGMAQELEALAEQLAREIRHLVIAQPHAEHIARRKPPLLDRIVPVLDAVAQAKHGVGEIGDVARRPHQRMRGLQVLVDAHAVVQRQAAAFQPAEVGRDTDADAHQVARQPAPALGDDHLDLPLAMEGGDRIGQHFHALAGVQRAQVVADAVVVQLVEQHAVARQHGHLHTLAREGRRHLEGDEAAADHHRPRRALHRAAQKPRVAGRAQVVDAGQPGARHREMHGTHAGGDQQPVVADGAGEVGAHQLGVGVEACGAHAGQQGHAIVVEVFKRQHRRQWRRGVALEEAGRELRPVIRRVALVRHDDDGALRALLAQRLGGSGGGQAAAEQQIARMPPVALRGRLPGL